MPVRIAKIDAAAATPIVEHAVVEAPGGAAENNLRSLDAAQDRVEFAVADMEGVVMALELAVIVEQERQRLVDPNRREITGAPTLESEDLGEKLGGRGFVARRNDGVVERNGHWRFLA